MAVARTRLNSTNVLSEEVACKHCLEPVSLDDGDDGGDDDNDVGGGGGGEGGEGGRMH